ncbi:hypothetical protein A3770_13p69720 [Chloropicon primus]|uniref:Uncharacterized protein n=1 Tax=Chloropicon primus TaxID=1764295 RepID=A0A5B8MYI6_9CHLO|nr:hypothetical protein A3770_13p69720 [Chloropicon primus]|eukprot:QDZ24454.1 hypothetical protein A3770_13p69720 [Chloropicon primus]
MAALRSSSTANVKAGLLEPLPGGGEFTRNDVQKQGRKPGAETWLKNCYKQKTKKRSSEGGSDNIWRESVPPFFSPPPSQQTDGGGAAGGRGEELEAHRVDTLSFTTAEVEVEVEKENLPAAAAAGFENAAEELEEDQASTSFRTFIERNDNNREEGCGESYCDEEEEGEGQADSSEEGSKVMTQALEVPALEGKTMGVACEAMPKKLWTNLGRGLLDCFAAHKLRTSVNLYSGLSPRLIAEEKIAVEKSVELLAHELSKVAQSDTETIDASVVMMESSQGVGARKSPSLASPKPRTKTSTKVKSFVPPDLSQLEVSNATAMSPPCGSTGTLTPTMLRPASGPAGMGSVTKRKVEKTERTISRVLERLQAAEEKANAVPQLEEKIRVLSKKLKESRKWKDEAVIYKRMATALQDKVKETEASALHSHSVVLENMARVFESHQQQQQQMLESFPVQSQIHSQIQSPLSRNNACGATTSNCSSRRRTKQVLDEYLSSEEQDVGWGSLIQESCERLERKMREYDASLNLGMVVGAVGITVGVCSLVWSSMGTSARHRRGLRSMR